PLMREVARVNGSTAPWCAADPRRMPRLQPTVEVVRREYAQPPARLPGPFRTIGRLPDGLRRLLPARGSGRFLRHKAPAPHEEIGGADDAAASHLLDQQLPDILLPVVDHRGIGDHAVSAATALSIVVEGECERVVVAHGPALERQARDALPERA